MDTSRGTLPSQDTPYCKRFALAGRVWSRLECLWTVQAESCTRRSHRPRCVGPTRAGFRPIQRPTTFKLCLIRRQLLVASDFQGRETAHLAPVDLIGNRPCEARMWHDSLTGEPWPICRGFRG